MFGLFVNAFYLLELLERERERQRERERERERERGNESVVVDLLSLVKCNICLKPVTVYRTEGQHSHITYPS